MSLHTFPLKVRSAVSLSVTRAVRGGVARRTRLHTERGEALRARALPVFASALWMRATGRVDGPWMIPSAVARLTGLVQPHWRVFEFGAGRSTAWYAARCGHVTSVEHDERWLHDIERELARRELTNCRVEHIPLAEYPAAVARFPDGVFDLVVVDGDEPELGARLDCVAAAVSKVAPGGWLLLDDSDRPAYSKADALLAGWAVERFVGVKPRPLIASETSFYRRPYDRSSG